ncbi:hypothetical protein EAL2_808p04240 (plasmid) [Peptoclostridium acidaminophilum DSM 3953]|uniref:Pyruvate kinase C-terminal domain-containing protein n=1 Tax=Peptoclostridium acidaminophilum DSM 3953 TaxID=1286171 RepID=W8TJF3_PEPAC|nr:pyruvate kinase alpha/beta domain-containing protein [Peptoclostridium acidaminophilum]AHM57928.1 hypothetical protein EAL2_808p04240 [Peptoclostridium acidaminophilum DSM 3953]
MYYESIGKVNTKSTVDLAIKAAGEKNIKNIVVASSSGDTAGLFKDRNDINVVCVTYVNGFSEPGKKSMQQEVKDELEGVGIKVLSTTHVLSGAERGISRAFGGTYPVEIMANTLRMLGQGVKVCVEVSVMALDAGLIPYGEPIIAVAGSGKGADTAVIVTPSHASSIFETKINEIICKPSYYTEK